MEYLEILVPVSLLGSVGIALLCLRIKERKEQKKYDQEQTKAGLTPRKIGGIGETSGTPQRFSNHKY